MKKSAKRSVSRAKRALGLPHTKSKAQVLATRAGFDDETIDRERIESVAAATLSDPDQVRRWLERHDEWYDGTAPYADGSGTPMSGRDQKTLYALLMGLKPELCVETGTGPGASAVVILSVLEMLGRGRLYSLDRQGNKLGGLIPDDFRHRFEQRYQTDSPALPALLAELGTTDFFLHDSLHTVGHMAWEYETAWPYLRSGGCLCSHDVIYSTAFDDFQDNHKQEIVAGAVVANFGFWIKK
jgi:hypothetical protein